MEYGRRLIKFVGGLVFGMGLLTALGFVDPDSAIDVLSDPERAADAFD